MDNNNLIKLQELISIDYIKKRDLLIYKSFIEGNRQKALGLLTGLSESRIKAICNHQRRISNVISE